MLTLLFAADGRRSTNYGGWTAYGLQRGSMHGRYSKMLGWIHTTLAKYKLVALFPVTEIIYLIAKPPLPEV